jgi:rhodanese-related sulfurtransferase
MDLIHNKKIEHICSYAQNAHVDRSADNSRPIEKGLKMKSRIVGASVMILAATAGFAQTTNYPKAKVSFDDFKNLVAEVETHRASRLIDLNTFLTMSKKEGVIILDSRSDFRFDRIHLKGAKHLAFTDFTQDNLKKVIPNPETTILIYCNNNFDGNQTDFASKVAVPRPTADKAVASQFAAQAKPLMMALNIPTYINLYGYGYRNVYELHELVNVNDRRISFEGSIVEQKPLSQVSPGGN